MDDAQKPKRKSRSGSENRKRLPPFPVRYLPEERAEVQRRAAQAGMTMGTYIRSRTLAKPTTRARRMPSVDIVALIRLKAELNRVGVNLHQIAKHLNFGGIPEDGEIRKALADYRAVSDAIREAMRRVEGERP